MAWVSERIAVTSTAQAAAARGQNILVKNTGGATVFFGGSDVDATNGFPVAAGAIQAFPASIFGRDTLYVMCATTSTVQAVHVG